jgi:hypothetical protein
MRQYRFHLIGPGQPLDLEVDAETISALNEIVSRHRFVEGRMVAPDEDGVLPSVLIATSRIQCVVEVS